MSSSAGHIVKMLQQMMRTVEANAMIEGVVNDAIDSGDGLPLGAYVRGKAPTAPDPKWDGDEDYRELALDQIGIVIGRKDAHESSYMVAFVTPQRHMGLLMKAAWFDRVADGDVPAERRAELARSEETQALIAYGRIVDVAVSDKGHAEFVPGTFVVHRGKLGLATFVNGKNHDIIFVSFVAPVMHLRKPPSGELRRAAAADWQEQSDASRQRLVMMYGYVKGLFVRENIAAKQPPITAAQFAPFPLADCIERVTGCKREDASDARQPAAPRKRVKT